VPALFSSYIDSRWHGLGSQHRDCQVSPLGRCARTDPLPARLRLLPRHCSPHRVAPRSGGLGGTSFSSFYNLRSCFICPDVEAMRPEEVFGGRGSRR
jgi:hypothetical protein